MSNQPRLRTHERKRNTLESLNTREREPWWAWLAWGIVVIFVVMVIWYSGYHTGRTDTKALGFPEESARELQAQ